MMRNVPFLFHVDLSFHASLAFVSQASVKFLLTKYLSKCFCPNKWFITYDRFGIEILFQRRFFLKILSIIYVFKQSK